MHVYIITGASRGIGAALARQLLQPDHHIICISRSPHTVLEGEALKRESHVTSISFDFSKLDEIDALMKKIMSDLAQVSITSLTLINNAGMLEPIKRAADIAPSEMKLNLDVNLTAPVLMSTALLGLTNATSYPKRIVMISSGAGKNPYSGWSHYCTAKAGLDMFTRTIALEQAQDPLFKALSIAPGVVDTAMQTLIREQSAEDFALVDRFQQLKKHGQLLTPEETAVRIISTLQEDTFESGALLDVRELTT